MAAKFLLLCLLLELLFCDLSFALWWSLGSRAVMDHSRICRKRGSRLAKDPQSRICRKEPRTLDMILGGSGMAMKECQYQFRHHRWNCTDNRRSLKRILMRDTPETAFLNAIMSAGVTHGVTDACSRGDLIQCSCSRDFPHAPTSPPASLPPTSTTPPTSPAPGRRKRPKKERNKNKRRKGRRRKKGRRGEWRRGENRRERQDRVRRYRRDRSIQWMDNRINSTWRPLRGNYDASTPLDTPGLVSSMVGGGVVGRGSGATPPDGEWHWNGCDDNVGFGYRIARDFMDWRYLKGRGSQDIRSKVLLHNNEVGRLAVKRQLQPHCKCHGLSGSCTHQTCWRRLPTFRSIGARLREKFDSAIQITPSNDANRPVDADTVTDEDLIYLEKSPDFCRHNKRTGSLGTQGRVCNVTAHDESGCSQMCCGRAIRQEDLKVEENCKCRFKFCCEVTCQKCLVRRTMSYCM